MPAFEPDDGIVRDLDLARVAVLCQVGRHLDDLLVPQDHLEAKVWDLPLWADAQEEAQRQVDRELRVELLATA